MKSILGSFALILALSFLATILFYGGGSESSGLFNVTYDANGANSGSVPVDKTAYARGASVTVLDNIGNLATRSLMFAGWNTAPDGSGITYSPGGMCFINSDITFYAIWITRGNARWAKTVTSAFNQSGFCSIAVDASGNAFAVGHIYGAGVFEFGDGSSRATSVTGKGSCRNTVVVKYDTSGKALWAKTLTSASGESLFISITVDSSGDVYAAGYIYGTGVFEFGDGSSRATSVAGKDSCRNTVVVKYDTSGKALWAKTLTSASGSSLFNSITVDSSGDVYAAGFIDGTGVFKFGDGSSPSTSVVGKYSGGIVVKYSASGKALWAKTLISASAMSQFNLITVDASGNIYAAGHIDGTGVFEFGDGSSTSTSVVGKYIRENAVVVKYDASGKALWAKTLAFASHRSEFSSLVVDSSGNVYAAGYITGTDKFEFGDGYSAATSVSASYFTNNIVVVKYDASGKAIWAKTTTSASGESHFNSIAVDTSGNAYAAGAIAGYGAFEFGDRSSPATLVVGQYDGYKAIIVKYDSSGKTLFAKTATSASDDSVFFSIAVNSSGNMYAVGHIKGGMHYNFGQFEFGDGSSSATSVATNYSECSVVIVKY